MAQDSSLADFWDTRYQQGVTPWDAGQVPVEFAAFAEEQPRGRVLVPGCGSGYEVRWLAERGHAVSAIDFSPAAIAVARQVIDNDSLLREADFFALDEPPYDWVYERALLCALPQRTWSDWGAQMARLIRPGGLLAGYFFYADTPKGPPFGLHDAQLRQLLEPGFRRLDDRPTDTGLPIFSGRERWQVWQRQDSAGT